MNVYDYFKQRLGVNSTDKSLSDLPVESNCGEECKKAIDAGKALIDCIKMATEDEREIAHVVKVVDHCVQVYWRG